MQLQSEPLSFPYVYSSVAHFPVPRKEGQPSNIPNNTSVSIKRFEVLVHRNNVVVGFTIHQCGRFSNATVLNA